MQHPQICAHADRRTLMAIEPGLKIRGGHHPDRTTVFNQGHELLAGEQARERYGTASCPRNAEYGLEHLDAVAHQHSHPVAALQTTLQQRMGRAADVGIKLAPGAMHLATDHGRLARLKPAMAGEEFSDQDLRVIEGIGVVHQSRS